MAALQARFGRVCRGDPGNTDFQHMWHSPDGRVPRGAPTAQVYAFAPVTAGELARLMATGEDGGGFACGDATPGVNSCSD